MVEVYFACRHGRYEKKSVSESGVMVEVYFACRHGRYEQNRSVRVVLW